MEVQAGRVPGLIGSHSHGSSMEISYSQVQKFGKGLSIKVMRKRSYKDCFQSHIKRVMEVMESHLQGQRAIRDYRNEGLRRDLYKKFTG